MSIPIGRHPRHSRNPRLRLWLRPRGRATNYMIVKQRVSNLAQFQAAFNELRPTRESYGLHDVGQYCSADEADIFRDCSHGPRSIILHVQSELRFHEKLVLRDTK